MRGEKLYDPLEHDAVHGYFGLTYANYLVLHRTLLQSMPDEWQARFVTCLNELDDAIGGTEVAEAYMVRARQRGRFVADPVPHYDRGRTRVPLAHTEESG